jgi:cytochrome P450 family 628
MSSTLLPSSFQDLSGSQIQCALATTYGILSHVLYFIHGERDLQPLRILIVSMIAQIVLSTYFFSLCGAFIPSFTHTIFVDISFLTAISTSIIVYRLAFHRLRHFPGPFWSKVTKAYGVVLSRNTRYAHDTAELHHQYGDYVRIGRS